MWRRDWITRKREATYAPSVYDAFAAGFAPVPWTSENAALKEELASRGAPFIRSYAAFVREFVVGSLRRSPLGRARRCA